MPGERQPLYYTFGNHMHWVDMEWLWGYFVLPASVRDMLDFCEKTGVKGNVNFEGIGYEKLAVEAPEALAALREAVQRGQIEVVGASYGQPYGLFHGGESNVRQRVYGARAVRRLLGVWPKTFWEEEFDFFPQLPQILTSAGFSYASLFFQWTWHTPEVPKEPIPAIWWEGQDGTRILTATRNALNLHQWPEDFQALLGSSVPREMPAAGIVQWLELMPSPDWMCRSELMLPPLRELLARDDLDVRPVTLSEYLEIAKPYAEVRRYTMDDVFHGMSLGKNGDRMRRMSRQGEADLLTGEALSTIVGFFGRPYPSWNVYPTWELEEGWRELLSAQHHDNDECEGLNGHIGYRSYERSRGLVEHVITRTLQKLADRSPGAPGRVLIHNPLGWTRDTVVPVPGQPYPVQVKDLPPFGFRVLSPAEMADSIIRRHGIKVEEGQNSVTLRRGELAVTVDRERGVIRQIRSAEFPDGVLDQEVGFGDLRMTRQGAVETFPKVTVAVKDGGHWGPEIVITREGQDHARVEVVVALPLDIEAVDVRFSAHDLPRPDGRMHASLQTAIAVNLASYRLIHDHPYGLSEIKAEGTYLRKYPTGDWMTSPQEFETIVNPFTAYSLLDFDAGDRGLLLLHDGSQAMFRDGNVVRTILTMYDPWDEEYFINNFNAEFRLVPHGALRHADRWRLAQEFERPPRLATSSRPGGDLPTVFGPLWCDAPGVAVTALYREEPEAGYGLERYAGEGIAYPVIVRLVEFNGEPATAHLLVPGPVAKAVRATVRGDALADVPMEPASPPAGHDAPAEWTRLAVEMRPYEIATIYLDPVLARKVSRNLDEYRSVWATVHRVGETTSE
ncbi:MAG TPA: hypothetical protein VIL01_07605 [Thermomicrobiales bacterium]